MTFDEFQEFAAKTAIYPREAAIFYPALGLAGEVGEVAEKVAGEWPDGSLPTLHMAAHAGKVANQVKKIIRDDDGEITESRRKAIAKEIGGVLWYCAALATDLGFNLGDIARENSAILASRAERGTLKGDGDDR
jgi:NTP pyrophosphatase (non-canonical NTP hydrolase)